MTTDPKFDETLRDFAAGIHEVFAGTQERQRQQLHEKIRAMLETARTRVGGELAEALLQVLLVADKWAADAVAQPALRTVIEKTAAADEILTAIENGLMLERQS